MDKEYGAASGRADQRKRRQDGNRYQEDTEAKHNYGRMIILFFHILRYAHRHCHWNAFHCC